MNSASLCQRSWSVHRKAFIGSFFIEVPRGVARLLAGGGITEGPAGWEVRGRGVSIMPPRGGLIRATPNTFDYVVQS